MARTDIPRRLIWHIGDHKTGTTAIQAALKAASGSEMAFVTDRFNHTWLARRLHHGVHSPQARDGFLRLRKMLHGTDAPVAVVSAEEFEHVPPEVLREAIATYLPRYQRRVEVIAYVRPHIEAIRSRYCENTKLGSFFGSPARMALALRRWDVMPYAPRFTAWAAAFPKRFTLRPMVRDALTGGDAVTDFFAHTGLASLPVPAAQKAVNAALSAEDLAAVRDIQAILVSVGVEDILRANVGRALGDALTADPDPAHHPVTLPKALCTGLAWWYRADAAALDKAFFDGDVVRRALALSVARESGPLRRSDRRRLPGDLAELVADRGATLARLPVRDRSAAIGDLVQALAPRLRAMPA